VLDMFSINTIILLQVWCVYPVRCVVPLCE